MYNFVEDDFREKIVAFDFDNTISRDPELFQQLMNLFEQRGWQVIIVTYRQSDCFPEDLDFLMERGYKIYFTGQVAKLDYMMENTNIIPDLWVDDDPHCLVFDYNPVKGVYYKATIDTDK